MMMGTLPYWRKLAKGWEEALLTLTVTFPVPPLDAEIGSDTVKVASVIGKSEG
jgi:hypothetical protein